MTRPTWLSFSIPNAAEGVARLVDFAGTLSEYDHDFEVADAEAMAKDFLAVGYDLQSAVETVAEDEKIPA